MNAKNWLSKMRNLIGENRTQEVINELKFILSQHQQIDEILLLAARNNEVAYQIRHDIISYENATVTKNKIRKGLLDLLRDIEEKVEPNKSSEAIFSSMSSSKRQMYFNQLEEKAKDYNELGRARLRAWAEGMKRGEWDWFKLCSSVEYYISAIKRDPRNHHFWRNLGYVYYLFGEREKAEYCLSTALRLKGRLDDLYLQVRKAIDNNSFLTGGTLRRPPLPTDFSCPYLKVNLESIS